MIYKLKIRRVGNSAGLTLPKEALAAFDKMRAKYRNALKKLAE